MTTDHSIERTSHRLRRSLWPAAHVKRLVKRRYTVRIRALLSITALMVGCSSSSPLALRANESDLTGIWQVDLRPEPGAAAYFKVFSVANVQGKSFTGTFYDTAFSEGRINTDWGAVRFAFTTEDRSGTYFHSGVLKDGKIDGLSYSAGRKFVAYWSAVKK